jgi:hypothetical protein
VPSIISLWKGKEEALKQRNEQKVLLQILLYLLILDLIALQQPFASNKAKLFISLSLGTKWGRIL